MSKKQTFVVTVEFADKICDDNEIKEIAENIASSIIHTANTGGIAPEDSETYTKSVQVSQNGLILTERDIV
jgi:hypothetical protein